MPQSRTTDEAGGDCSLLVSVIIPVFNDALHLSQCLEALGRSNYPHFECLVVDDGSTDASREVACRSGAQVIALAENRGPARARNRGAAVARGEVLLFIDADVCVHPDTLARVAAALARHPEVAALIGSYDAEPGDPAFVSQYKNLFHHYVHQQGRAEASTFWSGCGAVRRTVFQAVGGFDEGYATACVEDIELGFRLRAAGHRVRLEPSIQVRHMKRWTFAALVRTDLWRRGVPWVALMLRHRRTVPDLNLCWRARLSTLICYLMVLSGAALIWAATARAASPAGPACFSLGCLLTLLALQRDFYRFFIRARGLRFAAGVVPLHLLYFLYSGLALPLGVWAHLREQQFGGVRHRL